MKARPDAADLLAAAREVLRDEVTPGLPAERRYAARMVARAVAVAERALRSDGSEEARELEALLELYGPEHDPGGDVPARVLSLNRRLARDLRAGTLDGACDRGVRALLRRQVRARLALSSPDYLRRCEEGPAGG